MTFQGVLSQEEADYVIQIGLNTLLQQGAIPFKIMEEPNPFDDVEFVEDLEDEEEDDEAPPNYS